MGALSRSASSPTRRAAFCRRNRGLVRLLPAAVVAPFAASLGDRFPRERFLLAMTLVGATALGGSAAAFAADAELLVFAFAALLGLSITRSGRPSRPYCRRSRARRGADRGERRHIDDRESRHLVGPLIAGLLVSVADAGLVFALGSGVLLLAALVLVRVRVEGRVELHAGAEAGAGRALAAGFRTIMHAPRARLLIGMIVAQTFIRGCLNVLIVVAAFDVLDAGAEAVGYMTAAIGVGGLVGAIGAMALGVVGLPSSSASHSSSGACRSSSWARSPSSWWPWSCSPSSVLRTALDVVVCHAVPATRARSRPGQRSRPHLSLAMGGVAIGSVAAPALVEAVGRSPPSSPSAQFSRSWRSSRIGGSWRSTRRRPRLPSSS